MQKRKRQQGFEAGGEALPGVAEGQEPQTSEKTVVC